VEVLGLVFKYLDKLDHTAIANVQCPGEIEHPWVALGVQIELRDIFAPDENAGVLVVRVDRRDDANATFAADTEFVGPDRNLFPPALEVLLQTIATDGAEIALDLNAEHLAKLFAEVTRNEVEGLLVHRTIFDRVEGWKPLEALF
jgi:hypothetical protein